MSSSQKTFRTLLIDDNEAFLTLAMHLLKANPRLEIVGRGYSGFDAVRLAESLKPELILMDLSMPGMGGLQATRLIKAQDLPPVIFIASHHNDAEHREHSARAGADGFLSKQDFDQTIDHLLDSVMEWPMAESRVLVLDADEERAEMLRGVLQFIDYAPVLQERCGGIATSGAKPADWVAVIVGKVLDDSALGSFVDWLKRDHLHPPLFVLPEHQATASARFDLHASACIALEMPLKYAQINELLKRAGLTRMEREVLDSVASKGPTGNSSGVRRVRRMVEQVASFDTTVLITGESGTGKEVVARAIHAQSRRKDKPFVAVNCGAIPSELLESELFGHEKGAFTGAITARKGRFELADGGTLFLDEIGDMSLPMQVKILRALQERSFERVGGVKSQRCDVRVIAATHRNLEDAIVKGSFREDLYYRLNVFPIETPPMRERLEDLPLLIDDIIGQLRRAARGSVRLAPETVNVLRTYHWPGNVRELSNLIERLAVLHPGATVRPQELPSRYKPAGLEIAEPLTQVSIEPAFEPIDAPIMAEIKVVDLMGFKKVEPLLPPAGVDLKDHIEYIEASLIKQALAQSGGVVAHAAKLLNTRRTTLVEKLRKYGLQREEPEESYANEA